MNVLKFFQGLFLVVFALVLSVGGFLTASAFQWASELESEEYDLSVLDSLDVTATSQVFARDGSQIGTILPAIGSESELVNRIPVQLDEVSPAVLQAIIAYEDDEFFEHYGIDLPAIARATYEEFLGAAGRGGSTITTQVVKNYILDDIASDRSLERKVKEWMLAVQLERRLTKAEILQRYINVAYWGGQARGLRAAAEAYFDKEPINLTLAEGLYLARLIPAPNARYNDSFEETRASMKTVLNSMVDKNTVSQAAADRAWRYNLQPKGWQVEYDGVGNIVSAESTGERPQRSDTLSSTLDPQLIIAVRNELTKRLGSELVFNRGGLKVYTTIDPQAQLAARDASLSAEAPEGAQLAIAGLDPQTGEILAMVGERLSLPQGELNRALQSRRQPGSSFKPFVVASAIEAVGMSQDTVLIDEKTVFKGVNNGSDWEPGNHDKKFSGAHTLRYHLDQSRNIPIIMALEAATPEVVAERATELGYDVRPSYALALGSYEVTPIDHAAAYTSFTNGGKKMNPYLIERVENSEGDVIYQAEPRGVQVWSPETAYIMLDMLYGNVNDTVPNFGLSHRAKIDGRWVGGKTGTTNDSKDIWFAGVTPGMVATVWIGYDDHSIEIPETMPAELTREGGRVGSSRQPIYIWREFVEAALRNKSDIPAEFPVPDGIEFKNFNVNKGGPGGTRGAFLASTQLRGAGDFNLKVQVPFDTCTNRRASSSTQRSCLEYRELKPDEISQYVSQAPAPGIPSSTTTPGSNTSPTSPSGNTSSGPTSTEPTQNGLTTTPTPFPDVEPSPAPNPQPLPDATN